MSRCSTGLSRHLATLHLLTSRVCRATLLSVIQLTTFSITSRPLSRSLIVSGSEASSELLESLDSCTSDNYVIVSQPGVSPADFTSPRAALNLQRLLHGGNHSYTIPDVVGAVDTEAIVKRLVDVCKETEATTIDATTGKVPEMSRVIHISFPTPSEAAGSERMSQLSQHGMYSRTKSRNVLELD